MSHYFNLVASSDSMESGTESDSERSKAGERSRRATAAVVSELPSTIARIIDIHSKALERCGFVEVFSLLA